jgi:hypothetical protein
MDDHHFGCIKKHILATPFRHMSKSLLKGIANMYHHAKSCGGIKRNHVHGDHTSMQLVV